MGGCVKNYDCRELRGDEDFEMITVEIKGRNPKSTWEVVGIYRAPVAYCTPTRQTFWGFITPRLYHVIFFICYVNMTIPSR